MHTRPARAPRIGVALALALSSPLMISDARAASTVAPRSTTTCSTVTACIFGINTTGGPGVEGSSVSGFALEGISTSGRAVSGVSKTNDGVVGMTYQNATTAGAGAAGVSGYDQSTNGTAFNSGVYGVSHTADGVQGRTTSGIGVSGAAIGTGAGTGVYGSSLGTGDAVQAVALGGSTANGPGNSGNALDASTYMGGLGLNIRTDTSGIFPYVGVGASITSGSVGLFITPDQLSDGIAGLIINGTTSPRDCCSSAAQGAVISGYNAMSLTGSYTGLAVSGATAIYAQGNDQGGTLFQGATNTGATVALLDNLGNLTIAGKLTQQGTFTSALRNRDGTYRASYSARSTVPTVEDLGEATLAAGAATVTFDPALAKSIDVSRGFLVFLTPQGATTGLYVSAKSTYGFSVREIGGARDSIAFDYRIVARPYGETGQRLAPLAPALGLPQTHAPMFYRHLKPLHFVRGKLDLTSLSTPTL